MRLAPVALVVASTLATGPARGEDADPWLGPDKAAHFGASAAIAASGYVAGAALFEARGPALAFGAAIGAGAGLAKEALDLAGLGHASWKDLAWDGMGVVCGLAVAWGIDLLARGVSSHTPLLERGRVGIAF